MQSFDIPEIQDRMSVISFVTRSNNYIQIYSVLHHLHVNLTDNQALAQMELDLELLEINRPVTVMRNEYQENINQKNIDIASLKARNFKHNNKEDIETLAFVTELLDIIDDQVSKLPSAHVNFFKQFKTDLFLGVWCSQELLSNKDTPLLGTNIQQTNFECQPERILDVCHYLKKYQTPT